MSKTSRYLSPKRSTSILKFLCHSHEIDNNWHVSPNAKFTKGLILAHGLGGVYIAGFEFKGVVIIHQNVTIGFRTGDTSRQKRGTAEGFIFIGSGAFIASDVSIGKNVIVGANAVITKDVPSNSIVVGANKIIRDDDHSKIDSHIKDINKYFYNQINDPKKRFWPNIQNNDKNSEVYDAIRALRYKYDISSSRSEVKQLQKEYKNLLSQVKVSLSQRLIWSKLYRFFIGKWLKTK